MAFVKIISAWGILFFINALNLEDTTQSILCLAGIILILELNFKASTVSIKIKKGEIK